MCFLLPLLIGKINIEARAEKTQIYYMLYLAFEFTMKLPKIESI